MPETTENRDLIDTALQAAKPVAIYGDVWLVHESAKVVDLSAEIEKRQPRPNRKAGVYRFTDAVGLVGYIGRHGLAETELYADVDKGTITSVINAHDGDTAETGEVSDAAGWGDHRAILTLRQTDDWTDWTGSSGKWLSQTELAEFIEQHLPNCVNPDGATMLELAQSFKATKGAKIEASRRIKSGETKLEYREDIEAKAGSRGTLDIPDEITLALQPFDGSAPYRVYARFRFRINDGDLRLSYVLVRPRDVLRDAFGEVVAVVSKETGRDIWHGASA